MIKTLPATIKEAKEQAGKLNKELKDMQLEVASGKRTIEKGSDDERKWDEMVEDSITLQKHIARLEATENIELQTLEEEVEKNLHTPEAEAEKAEKFKKAFEQFLRFGTGALDPEQKELLAESMQRAQGTTSGSVGGYLVPEGFMNKLDVALLPYAAVLQPGGATLITTAQGNDIPWPTVNDTTTEGAQVDENPSSAIAEAAVTFGSVTLKAYTYTSKIVLVSVELLQDSAIDVEGVISNLLGIRIGRALATKFTTGTGSSQPKGVVTAAAAAGVTATSATAITRANLIDLKHSVNSAYRSMGAAWMMNDTTLKGILKLTIGSADDRPLWQPSMRDGVPDTLEGHRILINDKMASASASAVPVLFGAFSKYHVRRVKDTTMFTFREKYMDQHQIGFMAWARYDGNLIDAGTNPIKKLTMAAT